MSTGFDEFLTIIRRLRSECPWDRAQTHQSLTASFIEEAHEVIESIDDGRWDALRGELGDVLLHVALQCVIAEERGEFTVDDVLERISAKMIRRHPHVFGDGREPDIATQKSLWEKIKFSEGRLSAVDGIPRRMPALQRAFRMQEKASKVGFDWGDAPPVLEKIREEMDELREAATSGKKDLLEEEFGDVLFALVNYARFINVAPETALHRTCDKFQRRFQYIEKELQKQNKDIDTTSLEEMDALWNEAKARGI